MKSEDSTPRDAGAKSDFRIDISSREAFMNACDVLHDATCAKESISHDAERGMLDIIFEREFLEDDSKVTLRKKWFIFKVIEFPIVRSNLHLEGLSACMIYWGRMKMNPPMFNECVVDRKGDYVLTFLDKFRIEVRFASSPRGYLQDLEFIRGMKGQFPGIMHIESGGQ